MAKVHVIDDDPVVRAVLEAVLRDRGHEVTTSADGRAAVADVLRERPDAVLLDVTMPGPDGWTVLGRLRDAVRDVRVLMLTGRQTHDDVIRARNAGADDYVVKPVDPTLLLDRLDTLLRRPPGQRGLVL